MGSSIPKGVKSQILALALAYLLGSLPFGYWLGRLRGVDVRQQGSGNIGATNVGRVLGKKWGYLILGLDLAKGWIAVSLARSLFMVSDDFAVGAAVVAVLGHVFPPWLKFQGGKGVATSAGVLLSLAPLVGTAVISTWVLVFLLKRIVSLASLAAATAFPFLVLRLDPGRPALLWAAGVMAILVWVRHRDNLKRLLRGEEKPISKMNA